MKTHYDVLNLGKNCSAKEIKDSFIFLSKKYHPDRNKSSEAHKKFVEVNEAYSVLGKADSRLRYDQTLLYEKGSTVRTSSGYRPYTTTKSPYEQYCEYHANNIRRNQETSQGYFTRSKLSIVCFCFVLMTIGSGIQMMAETRRRALHSHRIAVTLKEVRERRLQRERKLKEMQQTVLNNETDNVNPGEH